MNNLLFHLHHHLFQSTGRIRLKFLTRELNIHVVGGRAVIVLVFIHTIGKRVDPSLLVHMRADGDHTPDVVLKRSWLHALHPDERPDAVYDDRQRVVDMWRDEGITCFQVAADWEKDKRSMAPTCDPLLTIMVGPAAGGKSTWCDMHVASDECLSSDNLRAEFTGDFRDQSRNADVFTALHLIAKARLASGLPVTIDATNLHRKDRLACVELAPPGVGVRYVVCNRSMADKVRDGGWRNSVIMGDGKTLIEAHEQRFKSQLRDILRGDGLPQVTVVVVGNDGAVHPTVEFMVAA